MLVLSSPVYFGNFNRFKAYEYISERNGAYTIFVADAENKDYCNCAEIVFQEWSDKIDSLQQVIEIVRKRYPDAFIDSYS